MESSSWRSLRRRCFRKLSHPLIQRLFRDHIAFVPVIFALASNVIVWLVVLLVLSSHPRLLGPAVLAYTYGLRHALDADHISAIDNLTRRLIEEGQRPVTVGLWFSLGHSTVVVMTCIVIAATSAALADKFHNYEAIGGVIGTSISMSFLLLIGFANCWVFYRLSRAMHQELKRRKVHKQAQESSPSTEGPSRLDAPEAVKTSGILFRLFSKVFKLIDRPWKMYPLGILFGLGFDTSTEIALLGIASLQGSTGTPIFLIMVFPTVFTAGMLLIDTIDGAGMYLAYTSNVFKEDKIGRLYYTMILTGMSIFVALTIGSIQMFTLILNTAKPKGKFWDGIETAGDSYDIIGGTIVGAFVLVVLLSALMHWFLIKRVSKSNVLVASEASDDTLEQPHDVQCQDSYKKEDSGYLKSATAEIAEMR